MGKEGAGEDPRRESAALRLVNKDVGGSSRPDISPNLLKETLRRRL